MGILDTFFIVFESDTSKLNDGLKESEKNAEHTKNKLFEADSAAEKLGDSFKEVVAQLGGAFIAMATFEGIKDGIMESAEYADNLGKVSDALDVSVENLAAWGEAVKLAGGTAEGFQSTLSMMSADFAMIATKGTSRSLPFWKEMGIQLKDSHGKMRDVMDVLPDLADKFEKMGKQESIGMGRKMGLDEGTIMLLQGGRRSVEEMVAKMKELNTVTDKQAHDAAEFNDSIDMMHMAFRSLFVSMGSSLLPAFKAVAGFITGMVGWFREHKDFATGLFMALGAAITVWLLPPLIEMGTAAIVAFAPFLIMGAIIAGVAAAFALLYDDVMNFMDGNNSMIGDIAQKWPIVGVLVKDMVGSLNALWGVAKAIFGLLADLILDPMHAWDNFIKAIDDGIAKMASKFPDLFDTLSEYAGKIMDIVGAVGEFFGMGGIDMKVAHKVAGTASATPLNSINSSAISNSRSVANAQTVTVGKVEVHTKATDAEGIARSVGGHLQAQVKRATSQYDDGVKA